jgi:DNA-binding NarL/FixJ family response regulator
MAKLKICIADGHEISRRGLGALVDDHPEWTLVGEASSVRSAVKLARRLAPDIMVVDLLLPDLPTQSGLAAARQIRSATKTKVIVLATHPSDELKQEAARAGAHGLILKSATGAELIRAIEAVSKGKIYLSESFAGPSVPAEPAAHVSNFGLTPRERELVCHLCDGASNKEIAEAMGFSIRTVETYRAAVKAKLGLNSTAEIIRWAIRNHLIEP